MFARWTDAQMSCIFWAMHDWLKSLYISLVQASIHWLTTLPIKQSELLLSTGQCTLPRTTPAECLVLVSGLSCTSNPLDSLYRFSWAQFRCSKGIETSMWWLLELSQHQLHCKLRPQLLFSKGEGIPSRSGVQSSNYITWSSVQPVLNGVQLTQVSVLRDTVDGATDLARSVPQHQLHYIYKCYVHMLCVYIQYVNMQSHYFAILALMSFWRNFTFSLKPTRFKACHTKAVHHKTCEKRKYLFICVSWSLRWVAHTKTRFVWYDWPVCLTPCPHLHISESESSY